MWSFTHNYFGYDPIRGDFSVAGVSYQWNDGIFSVTLGNVLPNGYRTAFFHSMASVSEFAVSTQILRNETASTRSFHGADFMVIPISYSTYLLLVNVIMRKMFTLKRCYF